MRPRVPLNHSNGVTIANNPAQQFLYQTERFSSNGPLIYRFFVPPGYVYNVKLKFAEIYFTTPGSRIFNVSANYHPIPALQNFDIVQAAGRANRSYDYIWPLDGGEIRIELDPIVSAPKIRAIEITKSGYTVPPK